MYGFTHNFKKHQRKWVYMLKKCEKAREMAQLAKVPATKPDKQSLIPGTQRKKRTNSPQAVLWLYTIAELHGTLRPTDIQINRKTNPKGFKGKVIRGFEQARATSQDYW